MSVGSVGGERNTFGLIKDENDLELVALPAIAAAKEVDVTEYVQISVGTFATNFLITFAVDLATASATMTTKTKVIKGLAGSTLSIPVAGNSGKMWIAAETGGPVAGDLQIVKVRGS